MFESSVVVGIDVAKAQVDVAVLTRQLLRRASRTRPTAVRRSSRGCIC